MIGILIGLLLIQIGPPATTGTVSGVVLSSSGVPAAAVRVYAIPAGAPDAAATAGTVFESLAQTDASGRYRLEVPAGRYYIAAGSVDSPTYYPNDTSIASAKVITISAGGMVPDVNFSRYIPVAAAAAPRTFNSSLPSVSTGVLSGVIRYSDGSPASGIAVAAVPESVLKSTVAGNRIPPSTATSVSVWMRLGGLRATTDSTGRYRIDSVSPDSYNILAGFSDSPVFYPGSTDINAATTITTTPTTMLDTLHFNIPAAKRTPVRARVLGRAGLPVGGVSLELSSPDAPFAFSSFLPRRVYIAANTGDDGSAEFAPVFAGKYTLGAKLPPAAPISKLLEIRDQPVNVELSLPVNIVSGQVLWQDDTPVSDPALNQMAFSTTDNTNVTATTILPITQGGEFRGVLDSKDYRVFIRNLPERYRIESITSGTADLTKESLKLDDDHSANVQIRISPKKNAIANVRGRIVDVLSGMPSVADRIQICCFASGPFERLSTEMLSDGSFEFSGVPAGRYELEMRGKAPGRIVEPLVEVSNRGETRLNLLSAQQFVNLAMEISTDSSIPRPQRLNVSVTFTPSSTPSSGETFRITATGPVEEVLTASVPIGIQYNVSISGLPPGFKVMSLSGATTSDPPPNSAAGFAGVYKALSNASITITITRSD